MTRYSRFNWPLSIGFLIVVANSFIALFGQWLAPLDPTKTTFIAQSYAGVWTKPPFPALAIPGYWLGSDSQGRDLLSQLMWAVRPTMLMVVAVAVARLGLGTVIGVASAWSAGQRARLLDLLISAALASPVLIVALAVIAIIGIESGVLAFIVGLSLSGWAETARLVREQTRIIKDHLYIEAGRAIGESELEVIGRHVLRQLLPVLGMLFAFEISATLLTTATLGFLGYYLGGGIWFQVEDFVAQRITGTPELGQMLAIAAESRDRPEAMFFAGSVVFLTVLGFNLLGEGLRLQLTREQQLGQSGFIDRLTSWFGDRVIAPASDWAATYPQAARNVVGAFLFIGIGGGVTFWLVQNYDGWQPAQSVQVAGNNLWANERRDPQGSLTIDQPGPADGQTVWQWESATGIVGGPAVAADGTIYLASVGQLYAVDPTGTLRWQAPLVNDPIGTPALGANGEVYVAGVKGSLSAFGAGGQPLWQVDPPPNGRVISGPIVGPQGLIFYPFEGFIRAISPEGQFVWRAEIPFSYVSPIPRLSPTGDTLIFQDMLINTQDGLALNEESFDPLDWYMVGADGRMYLQAQTSVTEWQPGNAETRLSVRWNLTGFATGFPSDSGVTRDGFVWLAFINGFQDTRIVWADLKGNVLGQLAVPLRTSRVVGVDSESTIFICGLAPNRGTRCFALPRGATDPKWQMDFGREIGTLTGSALLPGRIYLTTDKGVLLALGQ